jgi:hypothetical protein
LKFKASLLIALVSALVVPSLSPAAASTTYDQAVWFNWSKTNLDVLIADVHDPLIAGAIQRAITMWQNGIAYWNPTLGSSLHLRVYWADSGTVPPTNFRPDIAVVPQGFMSIIPNGGSSLLGTPTCYSTAPMFVAYGSFIRVTSHEFGHCLGLQHVFSNGVEYEPGFDIMGGGDGPKCPSNLNVQILARVFGGGSGGISMAPSTYAQAPSC